MTNSLPLISLKTSLLIMRKKRCAPTTTIADYLPESPFFVFHVACNNAIQKVARLQACSQMFTDDHVSRASLTDTAET